MTNNLNNLFSVAPNGALIDNRTSGGSRIHILVDAHTAPTAAEAAAKSPTPPTDELKAAITAYQTAVRDGLSDVQTRNAREQVSALLKQQGIGYIDRLAQLNQLETDAPFIIDKPQRRLEPPKPPVRVYRVQPDAPAIPNPTGNNVVDPTLVTPTIAMESKGNEPPTSIQIPTLEAHQVRGVKVALNSLTKGNPSNETLRTALYSFKKNYPNASDSNRLRMCNDFLDILKRAGAGDEQAPLMLALVIKESLERAATIQNR